MKHDIEKPANQGEMALQPIRIKFRRGGLILVWGEKPPNETPLYLKSLYPAVWKPREEDAMHVSLGVAMNFKLFLHHLDGIRPADFAKRYDPVQWARDWADKLELKHVPNDKARTDYHFEIAGMRINGKVVARWVLEAIMGRDYVYTAETLTYASGQCGDGQPWGEPKETHFPSYWGDHPETE